MKEVDKMSEKNSWYEYRSTYETLEELAQQGLKREYVRHRDPRLDTAGEAGKTAVGTLGELAFEHWCSENLAGSRYIANEKEGPDEGDFILPNNEVVDVKTQDCQKYSPDASYRCEITEEQMTHPMDVIVFAKLTREAQAPVLRLVGWLPKSEFDKIAEYRPRGTFLKGRRVAYPKFDVTISELRPMVDLVSRGKM